MTDSVFRIHPAIGFARVGTSQKHYLAPETMAGHPIPGSETTGGLPIDSDTGETIKASELRDDNGALKRQAARFRIYKYASQPNETYPMNDPGEEIVVGSEVKIDGTTKKVADIIWTVHMANKKTAWYESADDDGIVAWLDGKTPPLRNTTKLEPPPDPPIGDDPNDPARLARLITDPGPRAIRGSDSSTVALDVTTPASYWKSGDEIAEIADYPKRFPKDGFPELSPPGVEPITTLGDL